MMRGLYMKNSNGQPLYLELKSTIIKWIEDEKYSVGDFLPTEKQLQEMFGISRTTVRYSVDFRDNRVIIGISYALHDPNVVVFRYLKLIRYFRSWLCHLQLFELTRRRIIESPHLLGKA